MKKLSLLTLCAIIVLTLTACGRTETESAADSESKQQSSQMSSAAESISEGISEGFDGSESSGKYISEELYNEFCQNIKIGEKKLTFPCAVKDLAPELVLEGEAPGRSGKEYTDALMNGGSMAGQATVYCEEGADGKNPDDLSDSMLTGLYFFNTVLSDKEFMDKISVNGIGFNSTEQDVINSFGKPTEIIEMKNNRDIRYIFNESGGYKAVEFRVNKDNKVVRIALNFKQGEPNAQTGN